MTYYDHKLKITDHAIQRYIERSGGKKSNLDLTTYEAELEMHALIEEAHVNKISSKEIHYEIPHKKMIFVVVNNVVLTFKWK